MSEILFLIILGTAVTIATTLMITFVYDYVWVRWVTGTKMVRGPYERLFEYLRFSWIYEGLMTQFDYAAEAFILLVFSFAILTFLVFFTLLLACGGLLPAVVGIALLLVGAKLYYTKYKA